MKSKEIQSHELEYGGRPNGFLYYLVCKLSKIILKLKYNIKIENRIISGLKPPFIVLGNHASKLDPFIMTLSLYPHRINYLGTNYYFRNPLLRPLLRAGGIIPKVQFYRDTRAVRMMSRVVSNGGALGIFPEGKRSIDGTMSPISDAIAKLIKLYRVPVVTMLTCGAYLSLPRWSSFSRKGTIEVSVKPLLGPEEIEGLSIEEIKALVCSSLDYNDYEWNRSKRISFKHRRIAEKIDCILHQCPSCGEEKSISARENRIYCRACGNTAIMDEYGFMSPENKNSVIFENTAKWLEWQRNRALESVMDDNFHITSRVKKLKKADSLTGPYHDSGHGELLLNREGLAFKGVFKSKPLEMFFPRKVLTSIVSEFGLNFEITDGKNTYMFYLEDYQDIVRIEFAICELNKL